MNLASTIFDVAAGAFYLGLCLLAWHWLSQPLRYVIKCCRSLGDLVLTRMRGAHLTARPSFNESSKMPVDSPSWGRLSANIGIAGAALVATAAAGFIVAATVRFFK